MLTTPFHRHRHHTPTFCGQNYFDIQVPSSYTSTVKKQCLITGRNVDGQLGDGTRNDKYTTTLVADSL
jgi:hypothetical protein